MILWATFEGCKVSEEASFAIKWEGYVLATVPDCFRGCRLASNVKVAIDGQNLKNVNSQLSSKFLRFACVDYQMRSILRIQIHAFSGLLCHPWKQTTAASWVREREQ